MAHIEMPLCLKVLIVYTWLTLDWKVACLDRAVSCEVLTKASQADPQS